jgi:RNA-binding protein YhbY
MQLKRTGNAQLGKQGITENFVNGLKGMFENRTNVKVSVLKSAGHEKQKVKEMSEEILDKLGKNYTARVIGFTIVLKKWRKPVR